MARCERRRQVSNLPGLFESAARFVYNAFTCHKSTVSSIFMPWPNTSVFTQEEAMNRMPESVIQKTLALQIGQAE